MEITSVLTEELNYKIEVSEKYTFNAKTNNNQYKELLEGMKKVGYVKANSFSDITWHFYCTIQCKWILFNFDLGGYNSFVPSLKAYLLLLRKSGNKAKTVRAELRHLKETIVSTKGLKDEEIIKEFFLKVLDVEDSYLKGRALVNYLSFYSVPNIKNKVMEIFEGLKQGEKKSRDLPVFKDVLTFNDCVNDYFVTYPMETTIKFYPVFLWWTMTNIIPIRPIEFLRIKADCLKVKKDMSYWITIPRFKMISSSLDETHWEQEILINKRVYDLINKYSLWLKGMGIESNKYLITPLDWINKRFMPSRVTTEDVENDDKFHRLIKHFYEEVVEEQYGEFELDQVKPGDTRHFAIINMFLQGFNILSITRLAGHERITSPGNYYTHAQHFATSYVYKLAQKKVEGEIGSSMSDGFIGLNSKQIDRYKSGIDTDEKVKKEKWRKVDYGFCRDIDFPSNCVEDCRLCEDYYSFKPTIDEYKEGIKWLESHSKELEENVIKVLDLMATVSLDTYKDLKGIKKLNENESKSLAIQLFKYIDHKAIIDARLLEEKYHYE